MHQLPSAFISATASVLVLTGAACSGDIAPPAVRNLDRPSEIVFACFGDLRINGGDPTGPELGLARTAQPLESCVIRSTGAVPLGQEDLIAPEFYAFVLQSAKGTLAVINNNAATVLDSDPLSPGKNAIPIGTLPVGLASDNSGCYLITANAGSCDISVLEVNSAIDSSRAAVISRITITNASGEPIRAKPRVIIGPTQDVAIGTECPSAPTGLTYVAYPDCNLVVAIDPASGVVQGGILFNADGSVTITDGNVTCADQCGSSSTSTTAAFGGADAGPIDAGTLDAGAADAGPSMPTDGAPRPVTIYLADDGRLYIGAENSPSITIVDLDDSKLPLAASFITVEGDVGIDRLVVTQIIEMGGQLGTLGGTAGPFRFIYAIASDRTIRVVEADKGFECDTQVDPRYLHDERNVAFLSCMPVGQPGTPPRRPGARSPGIHLPRRAVPTDVAITTIEPENPGATSPVDLVGNFAFISTSDGFVFVINIDDDNYADFEDPDDPSSANIPQAIAHQIRDFVQFRDELPGSCLFPTGDPLQFGPRILDAINQFLAVEFVAFEQLHQLPFLRSVLCSVEDAATGAVIEQPVSELHFAAPALGREDTFPDLERIQNEDWFFIWEGGVSVDTPNNDIDGPPTRNGIIEVNGGTITIRDGGQPFCAAGVEKYDVLAIVGCDPSRGDSQCGIDETCFVHPDSTANVTSGLCIPTDQVDGLSGFCKDFLVTLRKYTILETYADRIVIGLRRRVLRTTPLDGCADAAECVTMFGVERALASTDHPIDQDLGDLQEFAWECGQDPTRAPGVARCMMACPGGSNDECEDGYACKDRFCVEGALPPEQCTEAVQRYQLRVGDAFAVIGGRTGFLHNRTAATADDVAAALASEVGECIENSTGNPLLVGRIPLRPPQCTADGLTDFDPNPCRVVGGIDHVEDVSLFSFDGDRCAAAGSDTRRTRQAPAIRLRNPSFTIHLVDTETEGNLDCRGDGDGGLPAHATVFPGYQMNFEITAGKFPFFVVGLNMALPIRVTPGPDGRLWVLDQGDTTVTTNGKVLILDPLAAPEGFAIVTIL